MRSSIAIISLALIGHAAAIGFSFPGLGFGARANAGIGIGYRRPNSIADALGPGRGYHGPPGPGPLHGPPRGPPRGYYAPQGPGPYGYYGPQGPQLRAIGYPLGGPGHGPVSYVAPAGLLVQGPLLGLQPGGLGIAPGGLRVAPGGLRVAPGAGVIVGRPAVAVAPAAVAVGPGPAVAVGPIAQQIDNSIDWRHSPPNPKVLWNCAGNPFACTQDIYWAKRAYPLHQ